MLRELHISGLGVIEDLDLELDPGLNVLTGETGAGKTMITVGLALALGGRASSSLVRPGAGAASVQARFDAPPIAAERGWAEDGEVILGRRVGADGRSTARIGGELAPVSALAELGQELVELHGQHQGLRLLSAAAQTGFLDRFAGAEHLGALEAFRAEHAHARALRARAEELARGERERERERDLLAYQVREIEVADPRPGERATLEAERARLAHAERLLELARAAHGALSDEDAAQDALRRAAADLRAAAELDPGTEELAARARALVDEAAELARDVRAYGDTVSVDPQRLEAAEGRLSVLAELVRKYGQDEEEILAFLDRTRARLVQLEGADLERGTVLEELRRAEGRTAELARAVSQARRRAAPRLAEAIACELRGLGMPSAEVHVRLIPHPEVSAGGAERAEIAFAAGQGQPVLPLARVASGGELSRTMLACRSALVDLDDVPTLVFDEVDQGIGGEAGLAVGSRLARLAEGRQVVAVTHLPQIAAFADRHVRVDKAGGTATIEVLDDVGRVRELSRMLSGLPRSETAAVHAEELLAQATGARRRRGRRAAARG